jgi:fibronectin-binding autotransporter adhesin
MSKYTANYIGIAKTTQGSGAWDLYDQGELSYQNKWFGLFPPGISGGDVGLNGVTRVIGSNTWKYHTFTQPGTLTVGTATSIQVLAIGGGGAGGYPSSGGPYANPSTGGGGGAGGVVYSNFIVPPGIYNVQVGSGGTNSAGGDSFISSVSLNQNIILAKGGGIGAFQDNSATPGGSGAGGGGGLPTAGIGIQTTTPQFYGSLINNGNPGSSTIGGGGGGASTLGGVPSPPFNKGGAGILVTPNYLDFFGDNVGYPSLNPLNGYYGGGGGGSLNAGGPISSSTAQTYVVGGSGGGGPGSVNGYLWPKPQPHVAIIPFSVTGTSGVNYSGGGGGGGFGNSGTPQFGFPGGSGIVVIRYLAS